MAVLLGSEYSSVEIWWGPEPVAIHEHSQGILWPWLVQRLVLTQTKVCSEWSIDSNTPKRRCRCLSHSAASRCMSLMSEQLH